MAHTIPLCQPRFFILAISVFFPVFRLDLKNCSIYAIASGVEWQSALAACFYIDMPRCIVLGFPAMLKGSTMGPPTSIRQCQPEGEERTCT